MDNDLNTADALGAVFTLVARVNAALDDRASVTPGDRDAVLAALASMDDVLGLLEVARSSRAVDDEMSAWVEGLIRQRKEARATKNWARADEIRDELTEKGIVLEDGPEGTRWKVVG